MKKFFGIVMLLAALVMTTGCERIATGEIGLRVDFNKTIDKTELQPGSLNQTLVGSVLVFPVKQIGLSLTKMQPQTADNSTLADFDITVIYNLNSASVYDMYTTKSHTFNAVNDHDETLLMYSYLTTVANSAAFKAVHKFNALDVANNRTAIEVDIAKIMREALAAEKLDTAITIDQVQVKNILSAPSIIESANAVITAQNAQRAALVAVGTAKLEAERNEYLSRPTNIQYMLAKAQLNISEAALNGKVETILIPHNMTMFGGTSSSK